MKCLRGGKSKFTNLCRKLFIIYWRKIAQTEISPLFIILQTFFLALYFHELPIIIKWPDLTNLKVLSAGLSKPRNPYSVFQLAVLYRRFITPAKNRMQVCKAKLLDLIIPEGKLFDFAGVYRAKFKKKIKQFPFYWHIKKILIWKRGRFPDFENYDFLARLRLIHKTARNYFQDVRLKIKLLIIIGDGFKKIFK